MKKKNNSSAKRLTERRILLVCVCKPSKTIRVNAEERHFEHFRQSVNISMVPVNFIHQATSNVEHPSHHPIYARR